MRTFESPVLLLSAAAMFLVVACTTTKIETRTTPDGSSGAPGSSSGGGPEVDVAQLGGACSGYGTGLGQTAAFETEDCAAGLCLVDAREGLARYCSADCTNATCPTGWECQPVDNGAIERACFRLPGDPDGGTTDPGATTGLGAPLTGYLAGAKASSTFPISRFKDPSKISTDLIVLVVSGRWSMFDNALMQDLEDATLTKTLIVSVLADGAKSGDGATKADLDAWHAEYPKHAKVLDSKLAELDTAIGAIGGGPGEIDAFPTLIGLDAATLEEVGRSSGYEAPADLKVTLDGWRAKTK